MARIQDGVFRNWNNGDTMDEASYEREREILRAANNDNHDRINSNKEQLDNHETRVTTLETDNTSNKGRLTTLETASTNKESRLTEIEETYLTYMKPVTFNDIERGNYTYDQLKFGYVDNKLAPINEQLAEKAKKITNVIDVTELGAKCDYYSSDFIVNPNPTDDTIAIRNAISVCESLGGGKIIFPGFSYCTDTLTIPTDVQIIFEGINDEKSGIVFNITGKTVQTPAINAEGTYSNRVSFSTRNIKIIGNNSPNVVGLWLVYASENLFVDTQVVQFGSDGIKVDNCLNLTFLDVTAKYNGGNGITFTPNKVNNACQVIAGVYSNNNGIGIDFEGAKNIAIIKPTVEGNGYHGIYLNFINGATLDSPYIEANDGNALFINNSMGITVNAPNISSGAENRLFFRVLLSKSVTFNSPSIKLYGTVATGTKGFDIQDSSGIILNAPNLEDLAEGIYLKNTSFSITNPNFVNVTKPINTHAHVDVRGRIDFIAQSAIDASTINFGLNKLVITNLEGNISYYNYDVDYNSSRNSCRAYQSSAQALAANTWATVNFQTKVYDPKSEFSTATNRFTASKYGTYLINVTAGFGTQVDGNRIRLGIVKNGTTSYYLCDVSAGGANPLLVNGSVQIRLDVNEYFDVQVYSLNAVNMTVGDAFTSLTVTRIN